MVLDSRKVLKGLVIIFAAKGFLTSMIRFVYFHIAGRNEGFSPVWLLPWFLTVVIFLESLVTMHTTKGFFTSVDCFMYFILLVGMRVFILCGLFHGS